MPQPTDITLNGAGYQLSAYTRQQDGDSRRLVGRIAVTDFSPGQLVPRQSQPKAAGGSRGLTVGRVAAGGVEPWPDRLTYSDSLNADSLPQTDRRLHAQTLGNVVYLGCGQRLYKTVNLGAGTWTNLTQEINIGAGFQITALTHFRDLLIVALGNSANIKTWNGSSLSNWDPGEVATLAIAYGRQLVTCPGTAGQKSRLVVSTEKADGSRRFTRWSLDSPIVRFGYFAGQVAIATRTSIFLLGGQPHDEFNYQTGKTGAGWSTDPQPLFSHGTWTHEKDFVFLLGFRGRLYTWLANQVVEYRPSGADAGWRPIGLEGASCYGATIAAGYLVVTIETRGGDSETWAFDGAGWWRIDLAAAGVTPRVWPSSLSGAADRDLVLFRDASSTYELARLVWRGASFQTYSDSGQWVSSLLDADAPAAVKSWQRVGASFAIPENRGTQTSVDQVTVTLDYSLDAGTTWTTAATASPDDPTARTLALTAELPANTQSRYLQLRVTWASVVAWAPVLATVWVDHRTLDLASRKRRWSLTVEARDGQVRRDSGVAAQTGQQLIDALWTAWASGDAVTFRDIDYDTTATEYQALILDIAEAVPRPKDAGRWGQAAVKLTLVEA